jgi:hypothetical protein
MTVGPHARDEFPISIGSRRVISLQQRVISVQRRVIGVQQRGWRVNGVLSTCHKQSVSVHWRITEMPLGPGGLGVIQKSRSQVSIPCREIS